MTRESRVCTTIVTVIVTNCSYCTPEFEKERQKELEEKEVAIQHHFQVLDDRLHDKLYLLIIV